MSINLENPDTALGMVDAAANYVAQIRLAHMVGDRSHAEKAIAEAGRLLFNATCKLNEENAPNSTTWPVVLAFARRMDAALRENMSKGTREEWRKRGYMRSMSSLYEKAQELNDAVIMQPETNKPVADCAVDVANFAMFIADACGGLEDK